MILPKIKNYEASEISESEYFHAIPLLMEVQDMGNGLVSGALESSLVPLSWL